MKRILLLKQSLSVLFMGFILVSCYSSIDNEYNKYFSGKTKMDIINLVGIPNRTSKYKQNEVMVYERQVDNSYTTREKYTIRKNAEESDVLSEGYLYPSHGNSYRSIVEFYIGSGGTCYKVKRRKVYPLRPQSEEMQRETRRMKAFTNTDIH